MAPETARLLRLADAARESGRLSVARAYEQLARRGETIHVTPTDAPLRVVGIRRRPGGGR